MLAGVITVVEGKRGCGHRKKGAIYLRIDELGQPCGLMPIVLDICPCCGSGYRFSQSPYFINSDLVLEKHRKTHKCPAKRGYCATCPLQAAKSMGRVLLIWIGKDTGESTKGYTTPEVFMEEAKRMGISRRIPTVPHGFKIGETWCWLAHKKGHPNPDGTFTPAVFHVFKPQRLEYVVKGTETQAEIDEMIREGKTPVHVKRLGETESMFGPEVEADLKSIIKEVTKLLKTKKISRPAKLDAVRAQIKQQRESAVDIEDEGARSTLLSKLSALEAQLA